jgi:hypothetical protein
MSAFRRTIANLQPRSWLTLARETGSLLDRDRQAFDSSGNRFVAEVSGGGISDVTPSGAVSTFASRFSLPIDVAFVPAPLVPSVAEPSTLVSAGLSGARVLIVAWSRSCSGRLERRSTASTSVE